MYFIGDYDKEDYKFDYKNVYSIDDGLDFYAPQTMVAEDGRRIMIGWMQSWDANIRPAGQKWSCMMTLPRELEFCDGKIIQKPVREIEKYHTEPVVYKDVAIAGECEFEGINGRIIDMMLELKDGEYDEFTIKFAKNEKHYTSFTYNKKKGVLEVDRTFSGMVRDAISIRRVNLKSDNKRLKIRMILDRFSAEIFINDGEQVLSNTFYTPLDADRISFYCDGNVTASIQKYNICID